MSILQNFSRSMFVISAKEINFAMLLSIYHSRDGSTSRLLTKSELHWLLYDVSTWFSR